MIQEHQYNRHSPKLFAALVKAQSEAKYVKKDQVSNFDANKPYAKSEDIINDCKELLNKHGLALMPLSFSAKPDSAISDPPEADKKTTWLKRPLMTQRYFKFGHESGEFEIIGPIDWPTMPNNMNTNFTAFGGTDTFSLAYTYRDILGMPRLTAQEIKQLELEEQRVIQALAVARAENGLSTPPAEKKKTEAPKEAKPEATKVEPKPAVEKPAVAEPKTEPVKPAAQKSTVIVLQPAGAPGDASAASPPTSAPAAGASSTSSTPASSTSAPTPSGSTAPATAGAPAAQAAPTSPGERPVSGDETRAAMQAAGKAEPAKAGPQQGAASAPETSSTPAGPAGGSPQPSPTPNPPTTNEKPAVSGSPTAGSSTGSTPDQAQVLKDRQTAIFQRLFRYAEKRLVALSGDEGAFAKELNAASGTTLYEIKEDGKKGAFKRPGLTDEAIKKLVPVLQMAGV